MKEKTTGSRVFRWKLVNIFDYLVQRRKMLLQLLENTCKPRHCEISVVTSLDPLIYFSKSFVSACVLVVFFKLNWARLFRWLIDTSICFLLFKLFEGMKAYRGVDGKIRIFRPDMNMERMNSSAIRSGLPTFSGPEFIKCIQRIISIDQEWVPHSEASSLYIRPTLIGIDVRNKQLNYLNIFIKFCFVIFISFAVHFCLYEFSTVQFVFFSRFYVCIYSFDYINSFLFLDKLFARLSMKKCNHTDSICKSLHKFALEQKMMQVSLNFSNDFPRCRIDKDEWIDCTWYENMDRIAHFCSKRV